MPKQNYTDVILEDVNHKLTIIFEATTGIKEQLAHKADKEDIEQLDKRLDVVEYAIKDQNKRLDEQGKTLKEHTTILKEHSRILKKQGATLEEHTILFKQQNRRLVALERNTRPIASAGL